MAGGGRICLWRRLCSSLAFFATNRTANPCPMEFYCLSCWLPSVYEQHMSTSLYDRQSNIWLVIPFMEMLMDLSVAETHLDITDVPHSDLMPCKWSSFALLVIFVLDRHSFWYSLLLTLKNHYWQTLVLWKVDAFRLLCGLCFWLCLFSSAYCNSCWTAA